MAYVICVFTSPGLQDAVSKGKVKLKHVDTNAEMQKRTHLMHIRQSSMIFEVARTQ